MMEDHVLADVLGHVITECFIAPNEHFPNVANGLFAIARALDGISTSLDLIREEGINNGF